MGLSCRGDRWTTGVLLCLLTLAIAACSQSGPAVVPAAGVVTLDGKPLAGATVTFISDLPPTTKEYPPTPSGVTDATGRYQLKIGAEFIGAVPGKYKAVVSLVVAKEGATLQEGIDVRQLMMTGQAEESVPATYSDPVQTTLKIEIPEAGSDALNLDLKSS